MDMHTNRLKEILSKLGCTPRKLESIQFFEDYLNQLNKILTQDIVFQFTSENSEIICNSIRAFTNIFLFCKDTSVHLEEEKNKPQVAALFKNSYKNLKVSINILDGWYLCFKDSFDDFKNVLHSMFDCINVLVYLDVMAAASVFKSFKGLYVHHKNLILKHISDFKWLVTICDVVELLLLKNFQDDIPKTFLHNIRFYKFIIGLALQITVDLKDAFDDAGKKIFFFACSVQRISMKHCHATQDLYLLLEATVKTCVKELLHLKNASPQFFKMLVTEKMNIVDDGLVHLVLFSRMLSELKDRFKDDIPLHWCSSENKDSLIGLFFNLLISLPSVFENNKILLQSSFGLVNVYEYLLMNLCSYIANLPPSCIQNVSDILFSTLLTSSVTFIFAADLLSFIARWSNEELCLQYIIALGKMLVKLGSMGLEASAGCNNMALLFRRMFLFLNEQQLDIKLFMRDYTFSQSIYLWIHMPLAKLKCEADDINKIATVAISVIQLNGEEQNDSDSNVVAAIQVLCNISQNFFNLLTASNQRTILQEVVQFWSCFCDLEEDIEMSESVVVTMLGLASYIFRFFQPKEMFLILSVLRDILLNCDDQLFRLQVTWFLSELKCVRFHESVQSECISIVACLFNYLIDHNDWVVSFFAMSALRDYAEVTVYSQAVSSFLPLNKKTDFTNFLKKESKQHWSVLQQNMHEILRDNKTTTKKCDVRSDVEDSIRECLTNISHNIEILKNLLSSSTLPSFCQVEVEKLIDSLSFTIMKKCSKKPETFDNNAL